MMLTTRLRTVGVVGVIGAAAFSIGATEARADHRSSRCSVRYVESTHPRRTVVYTERGRYYRPVRHYASHYSYNQHARSSYGHHRSARRHIGRSLRHIGRALRHVGRRHNRGHGLSRLLGRHHSRHGSHHR